MAARAGAGGLVRREMLLGLMGGIGTPLASMSAAHADVPALRVNLAMVARVTGNFVSGDSGYAVLNNGAEPRNSGDTARGSYGTWPQTGPQWVVYEWDQPVSTDSVDVYWWQDGQGIALPTSAQLSFWDGSRFVPVPSARGGGLVGDRFNRTTFDRVTTHQLKLAFVGNGEKSVGVLQWKVYSAGPVPAFAPVVGAGIDRSVMVGGQTWLAGKAEWLQRRPGDNVRWSLVSGPGKVVFADADAAATRAMVTQPGDYVLRLAANARGKTSESTLALRAEMPPPAKRLNVVYITPYAIHSPLWNARAKALIVNWIPHCVAYCERTDLTDGQGGIDNFVEAGKAVRGEEHAPHKGYVFSNARVHQTVESMCIALMVDPQGDAEIAGAGQDARDAGAVDPCYPRRSGARRLSPYCLYPVTARRLAGALVPRTSRRSRGLCRGLFHRIGYQPSHADQRARPAAVRCRQEAGRLLGGAYWARQEGVVRRAPGNVAGAGALRPFRQRCRRPWAR